MIIDVMLASSSPTPLPQRRAGDCGTCLSPWEERGSLSTGVIRVVGKQAGKDVPFRALSQRVTRSAVIIIFVCR